jgi:hypothetical protein
MDRQNAHTEWCARGHRCSLGEHRSDPITIAVQGFGGGVVTRVRARDGREHAEIRVRVPLSPHEPSAREQLMSVLSGLRSLVTTAGALGRRVR